MWLTIGASLAVAAVVLLIAATWTDMSGGRGLSHDGSNAPDRALSWYSVLAGGGLYGAALLSAYPLRGQGLSTWVDVSAMVGWLSVLLATVYYRRGGRILAAPLVAIGIVGASMLLTVGEETSAAWQGPLSGVLIGVLCAALVGSMGAGALAFRRLLRLPDGARLVVMVGLAGMALVAFFGFELQADSVHLRVLSAETGEPIRFRLDLQSRDTGALLSRWMPATLAAAGIDVMRTVVVWTTSAALLICGMQFVIPSLFYRGLASLALFANGGAWCILLGVMAYTAWFGGAVDFDHATLLDRLRHQLFAVGQEPLWLHRVVPDGSGPYTFGLSSLGATWLLVGAAIVPGLLSGAYRLRALISPVRNPTAEEESACLERGEWGLVLFALAATLLLVLVYALWGQHHLGRLWVRDSRMFLALVWIVACASYFCARRLSSTQGALSACAAVLVSWIAMVALMGAHMGWIVASALPPG